jgi:biopolymer transport protein ExbB/TolQ
MRIITSLIRTLLFGRLTPLLVGAFVVFALVHYSWPSRPAWQARTSTQQPALRIILPRGAKKLILTSERGTGARYEFAVASSLAGVREFWLEQQARKESAWRDCKPQVTSADDPPTAEQVQLARLTLDSDRYLRCEFTEQQQPVPARGLVISPDQQSFRLELSLNVPSASDRNMDLWLIPYVQSTVAPQKSERFPISSLHWTHAEWHLGQEMSKQAIAPGECINPTQDSTGQCRFIESILNRPEYVQTHDPQQQVTRAALWLSVKIIPFIVGVMIWFNYLLVVVLTFILGWWFFGAFDKDKLPGLKTEAASQPPSDPGANLFDQLVAEAAKLRRPMLIPLDSVNRGFRRFLEWLEVTGPALGFLLTVCALLIAFDPQAFAERDLNRFASAISTAMSATFAGLGIRVLAFTNDRLLEHVLRRGGKNYKVDLMDNVQYPVEGSKSGATDAAAESSQEPGRQGRAA